MCGITEKSRWIDFAFHTWEWKHEILSFVAHLWRRELVYTQGSANVENWPAVDMCTRVPYTERDRWRRRTVSAEAGRTRWSNFLFSLLFIFRCCCYCGNLIYRRVVSVLNDTEKEIRLSMHFMCLVLLSGCLLSWSIGLNNVSPHAKTKQTKQQSWMDGGKEHQTTTRLIDIYYIETYFW